MYSEAGIIRLMALFLLLIASTYADIVHRRIHNWISYTGIGLGIGIAGAESTMIGLWQPMMPAASGLIIGLAVFALPCYFGWLGGGDMKLMGAVGALQGAPLAVSPINLGFIISAIFYTSLAGACMAAIVLIWQRRFVEGFRTSFKLIARPRMKLDAAAAGATIPYGIAIVIGTLYAAFLSLGGSP